MMLVEIVRLLIVLTCTAGGYALTRSAFGSSNQQVLGATLGALVGYVIGGAVGRLLRRGMGVLEDEVARAPAAQVLAGTVGAAAFGFVAALVSLPAVFAIPGGWGWPVLAAAAWIGVYEGYRVAGRKSEELLALAGLSTRPLVTATRFGDDKAELFLVDTSAVIDGRLLAIADAGFLPANLGVPRFVLDELQGIADAQEGGRRRRGRRGLEVLEALRRDGRVAVHVLDDEMPEFATVDAKLTALARRLNAGLVTTDANLQHVAELQGVRCLNVNRLANSMKPPILPGEVIRLSIAREGKEPGQGVGFLDDGTMVVIGDAAARVGEEIEVRITSNVQTSVGRMLFASVASTHD
ncbi:MAG: TRAM domain-containing protein [Actinobacteria bacterium]|nr:MAG: TRAM domain-containing protein [Actinomycetota bacterium]